MNRRTLSLSVVAVVLSAGVLTQKSGHTQPAPRRIEVHAKRFSYQPNEITVKKGEPVLLVLTAEDVSHGLRFRELNVDIKAPKGQSGQAQFTPERAGDFIGHCSTFCGSGHGSMTLTLHVVE
ncbi:MAG TPA: cupredoxin domain-containing protein [Acidobacteriaceae bacterium]|nr:cupredoxin domain-containing protein [Acidobacteriaceae bacterium]